MGVRGPAPKRKEDLKGHRSRAELEGDDVTTVTVVAPGAVGAPRPSAHKDWHPIVKRLWKAMGESAQSALYQETDWAYAKVLMGELSQYKETLKRNSQHLSSIASGLSTLMVTEGDRRRLGIEVTKRPTPVKPPPAHKDWPADVKALWRAMSASGQSAYYEPSDWAFAYSVMEDLEKHTISPKVRSGLMLATINQMLAGLLITEGTRRRMNLELGTGSQSAAPTTTAGIIEMEAWRNRLTS